MAKKSQEKVRRETLRCRAAHGRTTGAAMMPSKRGNSAMAKIISLEDENKYFGDWRNAVDDLLPAAGAGR
jgi:hypothetical protein